MKLLFWASIVLLSRFTGFVSGSQLSQAEFLTKLPKCALSCLTENLSKSACAATDTKCTCNDAVLNNAVTLCVTANCTIREGLTTENLTSTICDLPIRNKAHSYIVVSNVFGSITGGVVILRLLSRYLSDADFGFDDYAIIIATISGAPTSVLNAHSIPQWGLGRDIWKVSFDGITDILKAFYTMEILYFFQVGMVKISILYFYLRIFPGTKIRRFINGTIILTAVYTVLFLFIAVFGCRPISYAWDRWDGEHKGTCVDNNALGFANAGISIVLDFWMLGLPLTQLFDLNLPVKKKVGVALMFSVGLFVTVVCIIRLPKIAVLSKSMNPTWDYIQVGLWSVVEINVGIICACMPNLRLLLVRIFPKVLGTTRDASRARYAGYSQDREFGTVGTAVNSRRMSLSLKELSGSGSESKMGNGKGAFGKKGMGILQSKSYTVKYSEGGGGGEEEGKEGSIKSEGGLEFDGVGMGLRRQDSRVNLVKLRPDGGEGVVTVRSMGGGDE